MTADQLFELVVAVRDAIEAFEDRHVEHQTIAEDIFGAATSALQDLAEILLRWEVDEEDE